MTPRFFPHYHLRMLALALVYGAAATLALSGCAAQGSAAAAITNDLNAPVVVEVTEQTVTVLNRTGGPLVNVSVVLLPTQGSPFTKMVARIDDQRHQEIAIKDLKTTQGAVFDRQLARPLKVLVSGANTSGQRYEAEVPWQ